MTGFNGFEVLKAAKKIAPLTSVIIFSGCPDIQFAIDALRLGADDLAFKPCDIEELIFRSRRCLEIRRVMQKLFTQMPQSNDINLHQLVKSPPTRNKNSKGLALNPRFIGAWDRNLYTGELNLSEILQRNLGHAGKDTIRGEESFANLIHPEDREEVLALRDAHVQGKTLCYMAEYRLRNKNSGWQWVLSKGQASLRNEQGKAMRIIGTLTDISWLKVS